MTDEMTDTQQNFEVLARLPILDLIKESGKTDIYDVMGYIEDHVKVPMDAPCHGFLFNCINAEEFMNWLDEKYGIKRRETVKYDLILDE